MDNYTILDIANMSVCNESTLEITAYEFVEYLNILRDISENTYFRVSEIYRIQDSFRTKDYVVRNLQSSVEQDGTICTLDEDCKMLYELEYCLLSALIIDGLKFFIFSDDRLNNDILEIVTGSGALIIIQVVKKGV